MRILISVALWGKRYAETFTDYSLASMLAADNIPRLAQEHEIVFHIMTTCEDGAWLRRRREITLLARHARIDWDLLEARGYDPRVLPTGPEGEKYSFLSLLQNVAITKSLEFDALIFNYADFIWSNGSLTMAVGMLTDGVDAVLSFCLPVDFSGGKWALDSFRKKLSGGANVLDLPSRAGADLVIRYLHREAKLRYWDGPIFTITPSYLLWPVGKEGLLVRAYHQTVLVLRVKADDPTYRDGITGGSLDGDFTTLLAERSKVRHAVCSDQVLAFSLYDTIIDSRLLWGRTRDESFRECLRGTISEAQRKFASEPFEVRRSYDHPKDWTRVAQYSLQIVQQFHETTAFDPEEYERVHRTDIDLAQLTGRWQRASGPGQPLRACDKISASFDLLLSVFFLCYAPRIDSFISPRALFLSQTLIKAGVIADRQIADALLDITEDAASHPSDRLLTLGRRFVCRRMAGMAHRLYNRARSLLAEATPAGRAIRVILGARRIRQLKIAAARLITSSANIAPNVTVSGSVIVRFQAGVSVEAAVSRFNDIKKLDRALADAEISLRKVVSAAPLWPEGHRALGRNYWFQGRFKEAMGCFDEGRRCLALVASAAGWDPNAAVILPRNTTGVIGLLGHVDGIVKHKMLIGDNRPYYLLAPEHEVVNRAFLDYWRDHVTVVTENEKIGPLYELEAAYGVNWSWVMPAGDDGVVHVHQAIARVQRQWASEGRPPLLKLKEAHAELLSRQKATWGMKLNDWFVCLHVRSAGFYGEETGSAQHFRNTPIESYYPLIRFILDAGGWVIRMGDATMPHLELEACGPLRDRVIDYAHTPERSQELDVALCASCRLFVSSPSGLHTVAHAFGRPVCPVNYPIYAGFPWHPGEIFIPQRYFSRALGRILSLKEILSSDLVHADQHFLLERAGVELLYDKPADIVEAVREALDPDGYAISNADVGNRVREEFDRLNREHGVDISGRLGLHFATTYANELCPELGFGPAVKETSIASEVPAALPEGVPRKLDVIIPSFNRPARLHNLLKTGLALDISGVYFVVMDDGSTAYEDIPGLGYASTAQVCLSFNTERVIYIRNPENIGVAASWQRYYNGFCKAAYTLSVTDKDEFINPAPIVSALRKLDADRKLSMVIIPLRQKDRDTSDRPISFQYSRMSGRDYLARYVRDNMLQHASMWGIIRVEAIRAAGVPRPMGLRRVGLDDGFGIDIDFVFMVAALGDVEFESEAHVRRSTLAGGTERFPLTFAYTYYQYAKRAMRELKRRGIVSDETVRLYMAWWLLLISRGLVVAYRPVHGTELERGTSRIRGHLWLPIFLYLALECLRHRVSPGREMIERCMTAARLMARGWVRRWRARVAFVQAVLT